MLKYKIPQIVTLTPNFVIISRIYFYNKKGEDILL